MKASGSTPIYPLFALGFISVTATGKMGGDIGTNIGAGETVEKELDAFIERRSRARDPEEESEAWKESVRAYHHGRRRENREAWRHHHRLMQRVHEGIAAEHAARAEALGPGGEP